MFQRILFPFFLVGSLTAFFFACQPSVQSNEKMQMDGGNTSSSRPDKDYKKTQMTEDGNCKVSYKFADGSEWPPKNKNFEIIVDVWTKDGKADQEFDIKVNADMPKHGHGMNTTASVQRTSKNQFKVSGMLMHMRGWWQIYIEVTKGCGPSKATFNTFVE